MEWSSSHVENSKQYTVWNKKTSKATLEFVQMKKYLSEIIKKIH